MAKYDVILLLGFRLYNDGTPEADTISRVETAYRLWKEGAAEVIAACGAKAPHQTFDTTQADVMAQLLIDRGVPDAQIIRENKSGNTWQNIDNIKKILGKETFRAAVVTTDYHVKRACLICRKLGLTVDGYAAPAKHDAVWRARRRLDRVFLWEVRLGWANGNRPKWILPLRERLLRRDREISNSAFAAYNEALARKGEQK